MQQSSYGLSAWSTNARFISQLGLDRTPIDPSSSTMEDEVKEPCHSMQQRNHRRILLSHLCAATAFLSSNHAHAQTDQDMVTQLFNADGSLKDMTSVVEAQVRTITLSVANNNNNDEASLPQLWVDGRASDSRHAASSPSTTWIGQYSLPAKWDDRYVDATTQERACTRISVYRVPYYAAPSSEKKKNPKSSSRSALMLADVLSALPQDSDLRSLWQGADLISAKIRRTNSEEGGDVVLYSEFDVAVAPATCSGSDREDLRLGFCPYDRIGLISAAVVSKEENDVLAVLVVESTRPEWQRANADLRRVRSSFVVT